MYHNDGVQLYCFESRRGYIVAIGGDIRGLEIMAVKHFNDKYTINELYARGYRIRKISDKDALLFVNNRHRRSYYNDW